MSEDKVVAKKRWAVSIPFTGYVTVEVDADSKEDAIAAAWESSDLDARNVEAIEFHSAVTEGRICHAVMAAINVKEIKAS